MPCVPQARARRVQILPLDLVDSSALPFESVGLGDVPGVNDVLVGDLELVLGRDELSEAVAEKVQGLRSTVELYRRDCVPVPRNSASHCDDPWRSNVESIDEDGAVSCPMPLDTLPAPFKGVLWQF